MTKLLTVENLHCQYDEQFVLNGVSFSIEAGELCALLGPSGCGKTTLLRAIAGFEKSLTGNIQLDQKNITSLEADQRGIGFVFQDYALFPHLTAEENIAYGIHKDTNKASRVQELLSLVELTPYAKRYPNELSGGQQQRIALARALAPRPKLLLLDEPFSNLDTELRKSLSLSIREILKKAGLTAILVTHDQTEAFTFGDQVGIVHNGTIEQWGNPYTLYHKPETRFIAEFIGQGQLIDIEIIDENTLDTGFGVIKHELNLSNNPQLLLSRPDDWLVNPAGDSEEILSKQFSGTQTLYVVKSSSGKEITIATPSHQNFEVGSKIAIKPQFKHIITF